MTSYILNQYIYFRWRKEKQRSGREHTGYSYIRLSTNNHGNPYSGSRGYQQRSSVSTTCRCHFFPSSGDGVKQDRDGYTGRLIQRQASQREQGVGGERFFLDVMSTLLPHAMIVPDRWVLLWDVSNLRVPPYRNPSPLCATSDSFALSEYSHT